MTQPLCLALRSCVAGALLLLLGGCGTTRQLPVFETPLARTEFQTVRTTAYTHSEADHLEYGNHNALGGTLQAAAPPMRVALAIPVAPTMHELREYRGQRVARAIAVAQSSIPPAPVYGSAAADWARWPADTVFRILSTGQLYRVDDYGWALAGRNTIDLYMPNRAAMNAWALREEPIQILSWGDARESLRRLERHQKYRHIRRMVLELEGHERQAAKR